MKMRASQDQSELHCKWGWGGVISQEGVRKKKNKKSSDSIQHPTKEALSLESNINLLALSQGYCCDEIHDQMRVGEQRFIGLTLPHPSPITEGS